jgi:hypothetical protein
MESVEKFIRDKLLTHSKAVGEVDDPDLLVGEAGKVTNERVPERVGVVVVTRVPFPVVDPQRLLPVLTGRHEPCHDVLVIPTVTGAVDLGVPPVDHCLRVAVHDVMEVLETRFAILEHENASIDIGPEPLRFLHPARDYLKLSLSIRLQREFPEVVSLKVRDIAVVIDPGDPVIVRQEAQDRGLLEQELVFDALCQRAVQPIVNVVASAVDRVVDVGAKSDLICS